MAFLQNAQWHPWYFFPWPMKNWPEASRVLHAGFRYRRNETSLSVWMSPAVDLTDWGPQGTVFNNWSRIFLFLFFDFYSTVIERDKVSESENVFFPPGCGSIACHAFGGSTPNHMSRGNVRSSAILSEATEAKTLFLFRSRTSESGNHRYLNTTISRYFQFFFFRCGITQRLLNFGQTLKKSSVKDTRRNHCGKNFPSYQICY